MQKTPHLPVIAKEVLESLAPKQGQIVLDLTAGFGGHAHLLHQAIGNTGHYYGIDRDPEARTFFLNRFKDCSNITHLAGTFDTAPTLLARVGVTKVDVVLADIGISSYQVDNANRGFSFAKEGPLDMRMSPDTGLSAADLVNSMETEPLANLIYNYGEERRSRQIADAICKRRRKKKFTTTTDLAECIANASRGGKIHPATRTFQALRIAVNGELDQLATILQNIPPLLNSQGRFGIISFHSLEDRLVKNAFKQLQKSGDFNILTKKPIVAGVEEIKTNKRSRSAKLRVIEKV